MKIFTYVKGKQEKQERNDRKQTFCLLFSKQAGKTFLLFCPCFNSDKQTMGKGLLVTDEQKNKAAVSQCTGNGETTALLIISKRVQEFTSFTTLASVYAKGEMFFSLLEGELVTNGKLEHAVLVVLILEGLGQTEVVATLNNEVAELIAQADRHRQLKGVLVNAICLN